MAIGLVLVVVAFLLRSWWLFICGPSRWLIVVLEAEQPGSWASEFRNVGSSPTVMVGVRCDRTRREGTRPGSIPQARLPSGLRGQIKAAATISFGCVRVCLWAQSISNNYLSALYITCIPS